MSLSSVSRTAIAVARVRARESDRVDRLFDDPLAAAFVEALDPPPGSDTADASASPQRRALGIQVVIRTRFFDDALLAAVGCGIRQVVLLAAGLDARAYRLPWPPRTQLYELDLPPVVAAKEEALRGIGAEPRCARFAVAADLTGDWPAALAVDGWSPSEPTVWLAEGLLVYLAQPVATQLLTQVTEASAFGSRLALDRASDALARLAAPDTAALIELWPGGVAAPEDELSALGWSVELQRLSDAAEQFGRPLGRTTTSALLTATRKHP